MHRTNEPLHAHQMFRAAPPPLGQETVVANVAAAAAVSTPLSYTLPEIKLSNLGIAS